MAPSSPLCTASRIGRFATLAGLLAVSCVQPVEDARVERAERAEDGIAGAVVRRPNLVVVMVDDLDQKAFDAALAANLIPNIKVHVLDRGTTFRNSFVTNSLCCPSRATYLTGQYTHNHGVLTNYPPAGGVGRFREREASTIATWLRKAGYQTAHVGKYLNGYGQVAPAYRPAGWSTWRGLVDPSTYRVKDFDVYEEDEGKGPGRTVHVPDDGTDASYQSYVLERYAEAFLEQRDPGAPFYLSLTPLAPHVEVTEGTTFDKFSDLWSWDIRPPQRWADSVRLPLPTSEGFNEDDVRDKPPWVQSHPKLTIADVAAATRQYRHRLEALRSVDDMVASLAAKLKATGTYENTAIVFTSDNGFLLGEHRIAEKLVPYNNSLRVPLAIAAPGKAGGVFSDSFALNIDLCPTLADLGGAVPDHVVDGRSLVPLLGGAGVTPWRTRFLVEHYASGTSKLDPPTYFAVRTSYFAREAPSQLYVQHYELGKLIALEHYDRLRDPDEMASVHGDQSPWRSGERAALAASLRELAACRGDGCRTAENR